MLIQSNLQQQGVCFWQFNWQPNTIFMVTNNQASSPISLPKKQDYLLRLREHTHESGVTCMHD